jgi:hypothetical protein
VYPLLLAAIDSELVEIRGSSIAAADRILTLYEKDRTRGKEYACEISLS